jgi:hypothetical protein
MKIKNQYLSDILMYLLFLLIFYGIFRYTESFNIGFNIVEDHIFIMNEKIIDSKPDFDAFKEMLRYEVVGLKRFRPVYLLYSYTVIKLFGINLLYYSIFVALICITTAFLMYKFCKSIKLSNLQSALFPLLTLISPATIMYIRPPDAEISGLFWFAIVLYLIPKSILSVNHKGIFRFCMFIALLLACLTKESFLLTIPALMVLYVWIYSSNTGKGILKAIKENLLVLGLFVILSIAIVAVITISVGIDPEQSYSGVDVSLYTSKTLSDFGTFLMKLSIFFVFLFGLFIILDHFATESSPSKVKIYDLLKIILLFLLIVVPQYLLYYKIGFVGGRYYVPLLIGFSLTIVLVMKMLEEQKAVSQFVRVLFLGTVLSYLIIQLTFFVIPELSQFSKECKEHRAVMIDIAENPNKNLLIAFDPVQNHYNIYPLSIIFEHYGGKINYKYDLVKSDFLNPIYRDTSFYNTAARLSSRAYKDKTIDSTAENTEIANIMVYAGLEKKFVGKNKLWFRESDYEKRKAGRFFVYKKK